MLISIQATGPVSFLHPGQAMTVDSSKKLNFGPSQRPTTSRRDSLSSAQIVACRQPREAVHPDAASRDRASFC
jgi:hypothetical protein